MNTTNYLSYVKNQSGNTAFDTLLCPNEEGQFVDASVSRLSIGVAQSIATAFTVNVNNDMPRAYYYLSYEETPSTRTFGNYSTNGKMAFIQDGLGGNAQFAALYYGTSLKQGNINLINSDIQLTDFSVKWNGATLEVYCSNDQVSTQANVTIYVPSSITSVRLNGRCIPYTQKASNVTIVLNEEHTIVVDKAVEPTCTDAGLTEGSHCSVCNGVVVKQVVIPAKGHTSVDTPEIAPGYDSYGSTGGKHCDVCGFVLIEPNIIPPIESITYSFGQSVQIGLIEPWFLKANARVYTDEEPTHIDYSKLADYGAYFIRSSELSNKNVTQTSLSMEDVINNPASVKCSKAYGTASVDGSYITANYDKGLYTYEMSDSIFVLFYVEDENGIQYAPIRERNIKSLLETRKNDNVNFKNILERNVYGAMDELEANVRVYRAQFNKIEELQEQKAPTLAEYVAENGNFENETVKSYTFGNSVQLVLVEPWGLKFNARVYNSENPNHINYNNVDEYGAIVYYDTEGTVTSMTAEALRSKRDAYVFSSKNSDASVDGSYITALYNKGIYTYQLDSNAYVMFYIKDSNGYHYGDVKVRNAYELAKTRGQDNSGNFGETEKTVYQNMVKMYDAIKAYRDDYFYKN